VERIVNSGFVRVMPSRWSGLSHSSMKARLQEARAGLGPDNFGGNGLRKRGGLCKQGWTPRIVRFTEAIQTLDSFVF